MIVPYSGPPYRDPQRYIGATEVGMWSSALVFPLDLICEEPGHPVFWRPVECAFGVACVPALAYAIVQTRRLGGEEVVQVGDKAVHAPGQAA